MYTLLLADGEWTARFDAHETMVTLGITEESVTIVRAEDGTYWIGDAAVVSGETTATASNGNVYTLMITTDDGGAITWMATYNAPEAMVTLGLSGDSVTLVRAEDGTYWLGDALATSGETMATAGNGNMYTLSMGDDGTWMATYNEVTVNVDLGMSGESVMIKRSEDGSYWLGDMTVTSGETMATATNGNNYALVMADDGTWSAMYVAATGTVTVGASGITIAAMQGEDGSWTAVHPLTGETVTLTEGGMIDAAGNTYALSSDGAGNWMATYQAVMQTVMLGSTGETVTLVRAEDGTYWLGDALVTTGMTMVSAENGNSYTLTMGEDGMWMAMYNSTSVSVALGSSGSDATIVTEEDGSYSLNGVTFMSGDTHTAANGNTYELTLADGAWSAEYVPVLMEIAGTSGLVAMAKEDGTGYDVNGAMLPVSGEGDIDTSSGSFRVVMTDGELVGTRIDNVALDADTDFKTMGLSALPTILADEDDTVDVNEANTALTVAGENYTFADLLPDGVSQTTGNNFVADAKKALEGIREKIAAVLDVFDSDTDRDTQIGFLWGNDSTANNRSTNVNSVLKKVFGYNDGDSTTNADIGVAALDTRPDDNDALGRIDDLIAALSTVDSLETALDGEGILNGVPTGDMSAADIFDATDQESTVTYGVVGMTRFGAITRKERDNAVSKAVYAVDDENTADDDESRGELGAFAFGVTAETTRHRFIQTTGNAVYEGKTLAVSGGGTTYGGDIQIRVRFATEEVDGLITNLADASGNKWMYLFDEVESIVLPTASMNSSGIWTEAASATGSVTFALRAGSSLPQTVDATFDGRLLGGNDETAGNQAVGTWSVVTTGGNTTSSTYLAGGFGADRVADQPTQRPDIDDGTVTETTLTSSATTLADGKLTIKVGKFGWTRTGTTTTASDRNATTYAWAQQPMDLNGDGDTGDTVDGVDEATAATIEYSIGLGTVVGKEGSEGNFNGNQHLATARSLIQTERNKLAVLIDSDQLAGAQAAIWVRVQEILMTYVFSFKADLLGTPGDWTSRLPDQVNEDYDADEALDLIDSVLEALKNANNLEEALDPDEDGIFVVENAAGNEEAFTTRRTAAQMAAQRDAQVRYTVGTTDFTRFGVWYVRRARSAEHHNWELGEREAFAYSPLPKAEVTALSSPHYTAGKSATYSGKTVAFVAETDYEGEIDINVTWNDTGATEGVGATLTTVISGLRDVDTGDLLTHEGLDVRDLVFANLAFNTGAAAGTDAADHVLDFESSSGQGDSVTVHYMDRNQATATEGAATLNGVFVGSSADGPLGVIGRYSITDFTTATGEDALVTGAFGAELP